MVEFLTDSDDPDKFPGLLVVVFHLQNVYHEVRQDLPFLALGVTVEDLLDFGQRLHGYLRFLDLEGLPGYIFKQGKFRHNLGTRLLRTEQ